MVKYVSAISAVHVPCEVKRHLTAKCQRGGPGDLHLRADGLDDGQDGSGCGEPAHRTKLDCILRLMRQNLIDATL